MSDYITQATVELNVNGQKAKQAIEEQRILVDNLRKAYAKAKAEGDASAKSLEKEYKKAQREFKSMQEATLNVANVLKRLDRATPKELKTTLKQLSKELNNLERGTKAWDEQAEKIRRVKKELDSVNQSIKQQQTGWQKVSGWLNKWQTMAVAAFAVVMKVVSSARKAVNAYAEMEQEMANVRKYTGMTEEQVEDLNEEFKKMDTRTSREGLNKLAQEAGRLGKKSRDDVLGFVRAADKINVALDDLGEGATLTLSKLTGIFGDEKRLGTEKSLLAVGSVINELSQNSRAASPYLAEFTSRMGGVGVQADMTIPQIMGYATVLDSHNQKVEASATALSQVITRLYQDPAKYAKPAGLEVQSFAKLLREDANAALILLLESLNKMGNMDVLSPIFAEMGETGSRAITALTTLAGNIDEVKQRQEEANNAFSEATSVGKEFNIQNNTVQAGLDKAKEKFRDLQRDLGQKLAPVMKHIISSSGAIVRILIEIISFVGKYKGELAVLTVTIVAYNIAVKAATIKTKALVMWQVTAKTATTAWIVVTQAATVATALFTGKLHMAKIEFKIFSALIKASPIGLFVGIITAACGGLALWITRTNKLTIAQKQLQDIEKKAHESSIEELTTLRLLYEASQDQKRSIEERTTAVQKLQEKYPDYFGNLSTEAILVGNAAGEYDRLTTSILNSARAKARKQQIFENEKEILRLEAERDQKVNTALDGMSLTSQDNRFYGNTRQNKLMLLDDMSIEGKPEYLITKRYIDMVREDYNSKISQYQSANKILSEKVADDMVNNEDNDLGDRDKKCPKCGKYPCTCSLDDDPNADKFKVEKEWRERNELMNKIAYIKGEKNYADYKKREAQITVEYYEKLKANKKASADELLEFEAQYLEAKQKQQETANLLQLKNEEDRHNKEMSEIKQQYLNNRISLETYNSLIAAEELKHKQNVVNCYKEGTEERLKAERDYQNALIAEKQKKQKEEKEKEENAQKEIKKLRQKYFGLTPQEQKEVTDAALKALEDAYTAELAVVGDNEERRLQIIKAYQKAKNEILSSTSPETFWDKAAGKIGSSPFDGLINMFSEDGKMGTVMSNFASSAWSMYQSLTEMVIAETEIQIAAIEKRYDKEISLAEGNNYKIKKLEKQKEKEIAKAKNEANKKQFTMQVLQAVAQTAQNAISAYGAGLQAGGVFGLALAPIAAAMAVAAGMIQIASIKKQQQAATSQGYASGGFTPKGGKYEPAGIVHKGEWVASQELLASPVARPMIETLDLAQRTNTIGSLRSEEVSRSITAPVIIASNRGNDVIVSALASQSVAIADYVNVIRRLNDRLDEPFVTVNTVTGDTGIKKAQDDYEKLIKNKTKRRKK